MSELISGKEALIALANGEEVLFRNKSTGHTNHAKYQTIECIQNGYYEYCGERIYLEFFIKPRTISLNGVEVPKPDYIQHGRVSPECSGWSIDMVGTHFLYKNRKDYDTVVAALLSVFKGV